MEKMEKNIDHRLAEVENRKPCEGRRRPWRLRRQVDDAGLIALYLAGGVGSSSGRAADDAAMVLIRPAPAFSPS